MRQSFLSEPDDMQWLADVHKLDVRGFSCAILYGNEDSPERVDLYDDNRFDSPYSRFEADASGELRYVGRFSGSV